MKLLIYHQSTTTTNTTTTTTTTTTCKCKFLFTGLLLLWWLHLVNAHEGKTGMVLFAGKTVWSMPERFECTTLAEKALYKYSSFPFLPSYFAFGRIPKAENRTSEDRCSTLHTGQMPFVLSNQQCQSAWENKHWREEKTSPATTATTTIWVVVGRVRLQATYRDIGVEPRWRRSRTC